MTPAPTMTGCLKLLHDIESTMSFSTSTAAALQAVAREVSMDELSQSASASDTTMNDVSSSSSFFDSAEIHLRNNVVDRPKEETPTTAALPATTREVTMQELSQSTSASDTIMNDVSSSSSFSDSPETQPRDDVVDRPKEENDVVDDIVVLPKEEINIIHLNETHDDVVFCPNEASLLPNKDSDVVVRTKEEINVIDEQWKRFLKLLKTVPFLAVPPEIHLKIMRFLNPIDATCLSLINKYLYNLSPPSRHPMDIGSPSSAFPISQLDGCKHCVPVLYHPAHCELHYHLRCLIPREMKFCSGRCGKYTRYEQKGYSDSHEICGECGVSYRRRYERGRRMLDMLRPGEKQVRLNKWYNSARAA